MLLQMALFCPFLWLINTYWMYAPYLYPFLFWWTFRLLPCRAIVNSAAVNIGYMYLIKLWFSPYIWPGVGSFFFFLRNSILFFLVVVPMYIPTNSVPGLPFLHGAQFCFETCLWSLSKRYKKKKGYDQAGVIKTQDVTQYMWMGELSTYMSF